LGISENFIGIDLAYPKIATDGKFLLITSFNEDVYPTSLKDKIRQTSKGSGFIYL
jgi:hypothetical protein